MHKLVKEDGHGKLPVLEIFRLLKFIYSEKATKFSEISTLLLPYVVPVKSKIEILRNFVAFSEYMNFTMAFSTKLQIMRKMKTYNLLRDIKKRNHEFW